LEQLEEHLPKESQQCGSSVLDSDEPIQCSSGASGQQHLLKSLSSFVVNTPNAPVARPLSSTVIQKTPPHMLMSQRNELEQEPQAGQQEQVLLHRRQPSSPARVPDNLSDGATIGK